MSLQIRPALTSALRIAPFAIAATIIAAALLFGGIPASAQTETLSADATLSSLTLSGATYWHPSFTPATTSYAVQVGDDVSEITVTATANHYAAPVAIERRASWGAWVDSNGTVPLDRGRNRVRVEVTAQDGTTTKTYYLLITRTATPPPVTGELSTDDPPVNFRVDGYSHKSAGVVWAVPRGRHISEYELKLYEHNGSEFVSLRPRSEGETSGGYQYGWSRSDLKPDTLYRFDLDMMNDALIPIIEASVTVRTFPGPDPTDATLSDLTLRDIDFGTFDPDTTSYTASVPNSVSNTAIAPTVDERNGATFVISANGVDYPNFLVKAVLLNVGSNTIQIKVTSEDGKTVKTYTVTVTRAASTEPTPTASPEPTPTASPEPTPTASPEPTPTASPEPTPTTSPEPGTITASDVDGYHSEYSVVIFVSSIGTNLTMRRANTYTSERDYVKLRSDGTLTTGISGTVLADNYHWACNPVNGSSGESKTYATDSHSVNLPKTDLSNAPLLESSSGQRVLRICNGVESAPSRTVETSWGEFNSLFSPTPTASPEPTPTASPEPTPIPTPACVQSLSGSGEIHGTWNDSCLSEKQPLSGSGDRYARFYTFTIAEATQLTIILKSVQDTYLYLLDGLGKGGETLHEHDDISPSGVDTNSELSLTLQPGDYTIEATTYYAEEGGGFELTIEGLPSTLQPPPAPPDRCVQTIDVQDAIKESWSDACLSEKPPLSGSGDRYARFYNFTLTEAARVTVTLESVQDTYLYLRSGSGTGGETLLAHDDITLMTNTNSHIAAKLPPGAYAIEATTYHAEKSGEFTLTVKGLKPDP